MKTNDELPDDLLGTPKRVGLRERIAGAKTPTEIEMLLAEGRDYTAASRKTQKSWKATAAKRKKELCP